MIHAKSGHCRPRPLRYYWVAGKKMRGRKKEDCQCRTELPEPQSHEMAEQDKPRGATKRYGNWTYQVPERLWRNTKNCLLSQLCAVFADVGLFRRLPTAG